MILKYNPSFGFVQNQRSFLTKDLENRQKIPFRPTGITVGIFLSSHYMAHHFYVVIMVYVQPYMCIIPFFFVAALSLNRQLK